MPSLKPFRLRSLSCLQLCLTFGLGLSTTACVVTVDEQTLLYPQPDSIAPAPSIRQALPHSQVTEETFVTADGTRLQLVRVRPAEPRATIFYLGGNGFALSRHGAMVAQAFDQLGLEVVMIDYRGTGRREGTPTFETLRSDALEVLDEVALRVGGSENVIVHGQSLGSFLAGEIATRRSMKGLVLESSATTTKAWVDTQIPALARPLIPADIAEPLQCAGNAEVVRRLNEPQLVIVGAADRTTPANMSEALYTQALLDAGCKRLEIVERAGHNDAFLSGGAAAGYRWLLSVVCTG